MPSKDTLSTDTSFDTGTSSRQMVAGIAILVGLLLQISQFANAPLNPDLIGYAFWLAALLLWRDLDPRTRLQAGGLSVIGLALLAISQFRYRAEIDWFGILTGNTYVVAMLVGVSFLGLIGGRHAPGGERSSTGARGVVNTWLSVHLLGAILNLSSVFMVGDHIRARGRLETAQLLTLNRGLSSAAFWSPFFASMGVAMSVAPDMAYAGVLIFGLPLAVLAGLITRLEIPHRFALEDTQGFTLSPASLLLPVAMAALVMLFHYVITPSLSIVSIITFLIPAVALLINLPHGLSWPVRRTLQHARTRLPAMRGEVTLFLSAGLFTLGLSTFTQAATGNQWVLFDEFGALEASISYVAIVISAVAGLHPIIGVSALASMLDLDTTNHTLLGFVSLAAWGVGAAIGPLSGINLSLQGRYGINGYRLMKLNIPYALMMSCLVFAAIALMDAVL
ncbi:hypothetical protein L861_19085 [Litchfieldella anticariensis FP35 = DSM 16096]|uniref:Citrate transporter-like domain-containing protein n=1 Tax=Litchfieldella anticariensis (strain DSM 16096 / CECT 5854 / CIP 108499 / LMG 22089 / FP35) TaxID=1121939 RepID=S2LG16_LITA3|nr:hypothetical protein [Halomonas anticariensis]EPC03641.1 hypothetical protein L861_19085 [Halomonas anticariensis FP35 = DSM 16096]